MKKIKMLENWFPYIEVNMETGERKPKFRFYKGKTYTVTEDMAKRVLRPQLKFDPIRIEHIAEVVEDLGIHIGRSKYTYVRNGLSKVTNG